MAGDARNLLRTLAAEDRRGAVFCRALCAASVAHFVPNGERRPWQAIRLALAWGMGVRVSRERLWKAGSFAADAGNAALNAANAAYANAAYAAYAAATDATDAASVDSYAATAAATGATDAANNERRRAHLDRLHALVLLQTTPIAPTPTDIHRSTPSAQVAWDRFVERCPDPVRIGSLGDALSRARRGRLRWTCPVERAIAERCEVDELSGIWGERRG